MSTSLAHFAVYVATVLCGGVLLTCLLVFPQMYTEINTLHMHVLNSVGEFKVNTDAAWTELMDIQLQMKPIAINARPVDMDSIFRPKRANNQLPGYCNCNLPSNCAPGPRGPMGFAGLPGLDGERGLDGNDAPPGLHRECGIVPEVCRKCPAGLRGNPGPDGERGIQGPDGSIGLDGNSLGQRIGLIGSPGEIGDRGLQGHTGLRGPDGEPGIDFIIELNYPGPKGLIGPQDNEIGDEGPRGIDGLDGNVGPEDNEIGPIGMQGIDGMDADNGPRGLPGITGLDAFYCPCPARTKYYIDPQT